MTPRLGIQVADQGDITQENPMSCGIAERGRGEREAIAALKVLLGATGNET